MSVNEHGKVSPFVELSMQNIRSATLKANELSYLFTNEIDKNIFIYNLVIFAQFSLWKDFAESKYIQIEPLYKVMVSYHKECIYTVLTDMLKMSENDAQVSFKGLCATFFDNNFNVTKNIVNFMNFLADKIGFANDIHSEKVAKSLVAWSLSDLKNMIKIQNNIIEFYLNTVISKDKDGNTNTIICNIKNNISIYPRQKIILSLFAAIILIYIPIFGSHNSDDIYNQLLLTRFLVTFAGIYFAYYFYKSTYMTKYISYIHIILVILFNPIIKFKFGHDWQGYIFLVGIFFIINTLVIFINEKKNREGII